MLTLFTTAKAFEGRSNVIQRNAIKSWTLLHPDVEVILFGDDAGAAEAAKELGIRHVLHLERTPQGTKYLRSFFDVAQQIARHDVLCYINCDIILTPDFLDAIGRLRAVREKFLMVGRRWDTEIDKPLLFDQPDWARVVRANAMRNGKQASGGWIDYFVFPQGLYLDLLPAFVIGRVFWDQWLVWKARSSGATVVDASEAVVAIHQNHDYGYHPAGRKGVWSDEQSKRNLELAGGRWHLCTIDDATHLLNSAGLRPNPEWRKQAVRRFIRALKETLWFSVLDWSRPLRKAIGLHKENRDALIARLRRLVSR
jgi:hypothetical protein